MNDWYPAIVLEAQVLEPAIVPAPGEPEGENESASQEREEDVPIDFDPLPDGSSGNDTHLDA